MIPMGCCGDDCNYCPRYTGTVNNDREALTRVAELWFRMGWRDRILLPEEMICCGCISIKNCIFGIKECCSQKHIDNCGYCSDMPCNRLKGMFDGIKETSKLVETLTKEGLINKKENEAFKKAFWLKEERLKRIYNEKKNR